jgi:hypothetical protein
MLHRPIVVFTIFITAAVHSLPEHCWSKRCRKISQGRDVSIGLEEKLNPSLRQEENTRSNRKKKEISTFLFFDNFSRKRI